MANHQTLDRTGIHLLVVDDDDRIRDLLKTFLSKKGFRVSIAESAETARRLMKTLAFDLIILDVMMPGESGFEFTQSLRKSHEVPIILLTAKIESEDRIEGLTQGADDYLTKPFEPEELVLRIESILRRVGVNLPAAQITFGPWLYDVERRLLTKAGERTHLTTGEEALLTMLARRGGAAVSRHALAEQIKAKSERAVDVQMTRLRRKIEGETKEPQWLLTVRGVGYRLLTETSVT
ncbi:MAG: response regulator transcription factor [Maricaulaceae bacterium]